MSNPQRQSVFLLIDDEEWAAEECFNILKPFLKEVGIEAAVVHSEDCADGGCEWLASERGCDVVFLDFKGVDDDGNAVGKLREINPYVPIVVMSNQYGHDFLLNYWDRGARTYIWKDHLVPRIDGKDVTDRLNADDRDAKIRVVAQRVRIIIDEYQPTKYLLNRSIESGIVVKEEDDSVEVRNRVAYLSLLKDSVSLSKIFPELKESSIKGGKVFSRIPFFALKTLRSVILDTSGEESCKHIVREALSNILRSIIPKLYLGFKSRGYDPAAVKEALARRVLNRLLEASQFDQFPKDIATHLVKAFRDLLDESNATQWNERGLKHPIAILDRLFDDSKFVERMRPPWISRIHGDLHFNNIMIDDHLTNAVQFRLIDPKGTMSWGQLGYGDPAYDFGKLFLSSSGHYDLIDTGYLQANFRQGAIPTITEHEMVVHPLTGGKSRAKISKRVQQFPTWITSIFDDAAVLIEQMIQNQEDYVAQDPDWLVRSRFYEAAHMLAATPIELPNINLATTVFIRGAELLTTFYDHYYNGDFAEAGDIPRQ